MPFVPLFEKAAPHFHPPGFRVYIDTMLRSSTVMSSSSLEFQTIEIEKDELKYAVCQVDVTNLPHKIPSVPFTLAIMDVPYGLKKEEWDQEVISFFPLLFSSRVFNNSSPQAFSPEQLKSTISGLRYVHEKRGTSDCAFVLVVFCSFRQLSYFMVALEEEGISFDIGEWKRPKAPHQPSKW